MKDPTVRVYRVGIISGEKTEEIELEASKMETDSDELIAYIGSEIVGKFREWSFYFKIAEIEEVEKVPLLPKEFGQVL